MFAKPSIFAALSIVLLVLAGNLLDMPSARAGAADVEAATYAKAADGTYRFDVTVRHADDGWEHYADIWQVIGPDGAVLGERVLLHPHDNEQPFTRSQSGIVIPAETGRVTIRAHDKMHGWGGKELTVELEN
ncbi:hypothetical protein IMCC20628_01913 [Hoeflea sp. IMCC20628]|uniref:hypothetical protein n=1 Tax=Hoeflea sp. IMCC20628 TaxID=1620421 RepID=UPI00063BED76|nr:hypothetical protein [Hoeflea sp. IMCC20628]AKI00619.1 hypothetical protein IMCC20628_01913 [Hoeflea sp. IMCC20628]